MRSESATHQSSFTSHLSSLFVGRPRELQTLHQDLHTVREGWARVVLVSGEPGIGKTSLLDRIAGEAVELGFMMLRGGASEAEGMPPYLPFLEALGGHVAAADAGKLRQEVGMGFGPLASILPELPIRLGEAPLSYALPPEQTRLRLFEAVASLLAAIAADRPLLLVLDDLQWADPSTLDLLCYIPPHQPKARLLIAGAYRAEGPGDNPALRRAIAELTRRRVCSRINLGPLSSDEIEALIAARLAGLPSSDLTNLLYRQSEGNPFFAEELLASWSDAGLLSAHDGIWMLTSLPESRLPESILAAVRERLGRLSPRTIELLEVAATIGRSFELSLLAASVSSPTETVEESLEPAVRAGLVRIGADERYVFNHDTIRECLTIAIGPARRMRLHQSIGQALEGGAGNGPTEAGTPAGSRLTDLAFHFARSGDLARGIGYAVQAAEAAEGASAHAEAVSHYRTALNLLPPTGIAPAGADAAAASPGMQRGDLLLKLAEAALRAGNEDESAAAATAAQTLLLVQDDAPGAGRAAHILGLALWRRGGLSQARLALEAALALLPVGTQGPDAGVRAERIRVLIDLASLLNAYSGLAPQALNYAHEALDLAIQLGNRRLEAAAERIVGQLTAWGHDIPAGIRHLEQALVLATAADDAAEAAEICGLLGNLYFATLDVDRSTEITYRRMGLAQRTQQPYELRHVHSWLAEIAVQRGEWAECERLLGEAQAIVDRLAGDEPLAVLHRVRCRMAYYRERYDEAERWAAAAYELVRDKGPQHRAWYLGELGLAQLALGKREAALACMAELETAVAELPSGNIPTAPGLADLVELAVRLGDPDRATEYAERLQPFQARMFLSLIDAVLGSFHLARRDYAAAESHLARADDQAHHAGFRPVRVRVLQDRATLAQASGGPGGKARVAQYLDEALRLCAELDLGITAARIRGMRSGAANVLPAGLSRRELEVLRLLAAGKSNREIASALFLSEKTVEHHITSIFNKTATNNRAAATAFALRHKLA